MSLYFVGSVSGCSAIPSLVAVKWPCVQCSPRRGEIWEILAAWKPLSRVTLRTSLHGIGKRLYVRPESLLYCPFGVRSNSMQYVALLIEGPRIMISFDKTGKIWHELK